MIIDLEHHMNVAEQSQKGANKTGNVYERYWDADGKLKTSMSQDISSVDKHLQFMDESGIDVAVLTTNAITSLEQCKKWNDFCAKVVKENPKRFIGFASIPPLGGKPALEELDRAIRQLGFKGVHIMTQNEGRYLDSKELWPFYEKVSKLGVPIDLHVTTSPGGFEALHAPYALYYVMARELDICAATFRICLGGVLEEFPDLVFIINHFGGGISAVLERIDAYLGYIGQGWSSFYKEKPLISKPWREYFNKLYFNMAGREVGMAAVKSALTNISPRRLMFGTDWPYNFTYDSRGVKRYIEEIRKLELSKEDIEAMLGGNAARLLGI